MILLSQCNAQMKISSGLIFAHYKSINIIVKKPKKRRKAKHNSTGKTKADF